MSDDSAACTSEVNRSSGITIDDDSVVAGASAIALADAVVPESQSRHYAVEPQSQDETVTRSGSSPVESLGVLRALRRALEAELEDVSAVMDVLATVLLSQHCCVEGARRRRL